MVRSPAKEDVFESHSGAETMPSRVQPIDLGRFGLHLGCRRYGTIVYEDSQALLDQQGSVKDD